MSSDGRLTRILRHPAVLAVVVAFNLLLVGWLWSQEDPAREIPAELLLTPSRLDATPDYALVHMTYSDLRVRVVADPAKIGRWRRLPEPARLVLILAWAEESFPGLEALIIRGQTGPFDFRPEDLAQAYEAIGAEGVADVITTAARRASGGPAPGDGGFAELETRFVEERNHADVPQRLRTYIRAHRDAITSAHL